MRQENLFPEQYRGTGTGFTPLYCLYGVCTSGMCSLTAFPINFKNLRYENTPKIMRHLLMCITEKKEHTMWRNMKNGEKIIPHEQSWKFPAT